MQLRIWGKPKLGRPPHFGSANISLKIQPRRLFAKFCAAPNIASQMKPEQNFVHRKYLRAHAFCNGTVLREVLKMGRKENPKT